MPSAAHQALVTAIGERPELLVLLLDKLLGRHLALPLTAADSTVRFADPAEVRPDLVLRSPDGSWLLLEVQGSRDAEKPRRWLLAMATMFNQTRLPGDLVVITHERHVAEWIERQAIVRGPLGSTLAAAPVVVLIAGSAIEALLDEAHPELAFLAAWAMQDRRGPRAVEVVLRAVNLTARLDGELRDRRLRGILNVLSEDMVTSLREVEMQHEGGPERPEVSELLALMNAKYARAVARGQAESVLILLDARGISLTDDERARIAACSEPATLRTWLVQAASARSIDELLG